jgi:colanic acid/amylovoran biosynthesis glycosyltransferase
MPNVLIYRDELLPLSETFIQAQAAALVHFKPHFAGLKPALRTLPLGDLTAFFSSSKGRWGTAACKAYRFFPYAPAFHERVKRFAPDLIHAHFALDGANALKMQSLLQVPLVVTLHGADVTTNDKIFRQTLGGRRYLYRRTKLWQKASCFLCVSPAIRRRALEGGFPEQKLRVHYIGVDCNDVSNSSSESRDPNLVLFVGRLVEKKGCEYLLRAMQNLRLNAPAAHLVVIGDGPLRAKLENLARQLGINAEFLGALRSEDVRRWMLKARVLCNPSVTAKSGDSEGFGMVFAEAQALGTPVASTLHSAIPDVVRHGETGLLAPERDYQTLGRHLTTLLKDEATWKAYSQRGMEWIRERFNIEKQTAELEAIYTQLIAEYRSSVPG